jgi:hypothetical protein
MTLKNIHDQSFYGLVSFYKRFIRNFNFIISPFIECLKGNIFLANSKAETSFQVVKQKMTEALVLALLDFEKLFEVNCDASGQTLEEFLARMGASSPFLVRNCPAQRRTIPYMI